MKPEKSFHTLVILDTAWGPNQLPKLFPISETNKSGRLLYKLMPRTIGCFPFIVGNACQKTTARAHLHGNPDLVYLAEVCGEAFRRFSIETIILGGKIAQETFDAMRKDVTQRMGVDAFQAIRIFRMPHPAARFWSHDMVARAKAAIDNPNLKEFTLTK